MTLASELPMESESGLLLFTFVNRFSSSGLWRARPNVYVCWSVDMTTTKNVSYINFWPAMTFCPVWLVADK